MNRAPWVMMQEWHHVVFLHWPVLASCGTGPGGSIRTMADGTLLLVDKTAEKDFARGYSPYPMEFEVYKRRN